MPYLIFWTVHQSIYAVERGGLPDSLSVLMPTWTLWFLVALFVWRLSVPVWRNLRWPVTIAVVISLFAAAADLGTTLSLGRVLSLLPFFVLGLSLRREHFAVLDRVWARVGAVLIFAATAFFALFMADEDVSREWLFWRESLTDRDIDPLMPHIGVRLMLMVIAVAMTFAMLALTPKKRTWFTKLGAYTLFVYLGHSVALILLKDSPYYDFFEGTGPLGLVLTTVLAMALTLLLCAPWVRKAMGWAVEPQATWLLRSGSAQGSGSGPGSAQGAQGSGAAGSGGVEAPPGSGGSDGSGGPGTASTGEEPRRDPS